MEYNCKTTFSLRREHPNGCVECRLGRHKSRLWANTWLHGVLWTRSAIHLAATDQRVDDTIVAGDRRSLFLTGDDDDVYDKKLNVTPKTTEQHLIVRSGTWSEAEMTIIKDCAWGITLLKLLSDTKHRAASLQQQSYLSFTAHRPNAVVHRVQKSTPLDFWG